MAGWIGTTIERQGEGWAYTPNRVILGHLDLIDWRSCERKETWTTMTPLSMLEELEETHWMVSQGSFDRRMEWK